MENNRCSTGAMSRGMVQATVRIRADQRMSLERERRARGGTLADVLRDNLDLALAVKAELSKIVEGEYDENDPKNAPRLVHTLLFRVEERILAAVDNLSRKLDGDNRSQAATGTAIDVNREADRSLAQRHERENYVAELVNGFLNLLVGDAEHSPGVWIGAFLEIVPRIERLSDAQVNDVGNRGDLWLEEVGYFPVEEE